MDLYQRINELGDLYGIDFIGVAGISEVKEDIKEISGSLLGDFPRALSIGIRLQDSIVDLLKDRETYENRLLFHTHAYEIITNRLDEFASLVSSVIQKEGYRVMPLPAAERIDSDRICASLSHKVTARLAGFGWIGKNCLLITPQYGPRVRWTSILTDAPFEENKVFMESQCGNCHECEKACPTQAILGRNYIAHEARELRLNVRACEGYFKQMEKNQELAICGMCAYACPFGRKNSIRK